MFSLKEGHSKTQNLVNYKFQDYLKCGSLSVEEKKLLFQLRTRSTHTKSNYKNKYLFDLSCSLCKNLDPLNEMNYEQTDAHLLKCTFVKNALSSKVDLINVNHADIYGNIEKQIKVTQVYKEIFKLIDEEN